MAKAKPDRLCLNCKERRPTSEFASARSRKCNRCKAVVPYRICSRCQRTRTVDEFVWRGKICTDCRADGPPCEWRSCFRCLKVKPARAFPWGDGATSRGVGPAVRRRRHVCAACLLQEQRERDIRAIKRRATWVSEETGRLVRRCRKCREVKDLETCFTNAKSDEGLTLAQRRSYRCKRCQAKDGHERWLRLREDHEWMELQRAKWREQARLYRAANPEAARANQARWARKVRANPERIARKREDDRIMYRLRQERKGRKVTRVIKPAVDSGQSHTLPAPQLATVIDRIIAVEGAGNLFDDLPVDPSDNSGKRTEIVCSRLGIPVRTLFAWRVGERQRVQFLLADRVLTRAGLLWWDVWNEDTTSPDELREVAAVFESGEVAA
jgi:hypothetical protein